MKSKVVILGVGNELNGDDGVGIYIARNIAQTESRIPINSGTAPENFLGKIEKMKPDLLVIVDAASFGGSPGEAREIPLEKLSNFASTHCPSIKHLIDFLSLPTRVIGIEPKDAEELSPEVKKTADSLIEKFNKDDFTL